jgi:hypothetical protein
MVSDISGAVDSNIAFLKGSRYVRLKRGVKFWCGAAWEPGRMERKKWKGFDELRADGYNAAW